MVGKEIRITVSAIRFILAMFISFALAILPVAAAVASAQADTGMAMEHCDMAPGTMPSGHCDCCDKSKACTPDSCASHCAKIPGCTPAMVKPLASNTRDYPRPMSKSMDQRAWPPPAPPPRA